MQRREQREVRRLVPGLPPLRFRRRPRRRRRRRPRRLPSPGGRRLGAFPALLRRGGFFEDDDVLGVAAGVVAFAPRDGGGGSRGALLRLLLRALARLFRRRARLRRVPLGGVLSELRLRGGVGGVRVHVLAEQTERLRADAVDRVGMLEVAHARREFAQRPRHLAQRDGPRRVLPGLLDRRALELLEEQRVLHVRGVRAPAPHLRVGIALGASLADAPRGVVLASGARAGHRYEPTDARSRARAGGRPGDARGARRGDRTVGPARRRATRGDPRGCVAARIAAPRRAGRCVADEASEKKTYSSF